MARVGALHHSGCTIKNGYVTTTPVGFEPTRGDPIGLAGRRLNHSAKMSSAHVARHMQKYITLQHHSPRLQQTSSQRTTVAPGKADPASCERGTRVPVVDVGGEPDGSAVSFMIVAL